MNSLIPPVPNRLDFILHLEDLVNNKNASIIDIGTGASCIYPLLGVSRNPGWKFLGLEIDNNSIEFAKNNVQINSLQSSIDIQLNNTDKIFPLDLLKEHEYDACICNPPFYRDNDEKQQLTSLKYTPSSSVLLSLIHQDLHGIPK